MADDRLSWREIDKLRDRPGGRRRKEKKDSIPDSSTRYQRYRAELDRLFDQGMTEELLRKLGKSAPADSSAKPAPEEQVTRSQARSRAARIDTGKQSKSCLKLMRQVVDAETGQAVRAAIDALVEKFGLPDDWQVLARVPEHSDENLVMQAVEKMLEMLPRTAKVPSRASLKQRMRIISQTARDLKLRQLSEKLSSLL